MPRSSNTTMSPQTESKLADIFRTVLQLPPEFAFDRARQLSVETWDSLAHVSLMLAIESEFGVAIDVADQLALTSYPAVRLYLDERGV